MPQKLVSMENRMSFLKEFPKLLELEYQRYWTRLRKSGVTKRELREGPPSSWFLSHYKNVESFLIERLKKSDYELSHLLKTELIKGTKRREIYVPNNWDRILVGCLREYLTKITEPNLSESLYSFRVGRGPITAGLKVRNFIYKNKTKKLFVSQRDVSKYGDNIDLNKLKEILTTTYEELLADPSVLYLLNKTLHWPILIENNQITTMKKGIPAGTPLIPLFENLYLAKFDAAMDEMQKKHTLFYGRYGDDIIWISPDEELLKKLGHNLEEYCHEHGLEVKNKKSLDFELKTNERIKWLGNLVDKNGFFIGDKEEVKRFKTNFKKNLHKIWNKSEKWNAILGVGDNSIDNWFNGIRSELLFRNNNLLMKIFHLKDGDIKLKQLDSWVREQLIHFLLKKGINKKEGWKLIRKGNIPSLNYQRRKYVAKLERKADV